MKTPLLALLLSLPVMAQDLPSIAAMKSAADAFIGSLDDAKRGQAVFPFEAEDREKFKFTPPPPARTGLPFKEMTEAQRAAATKLLDAVLSEKGKLKATQIMTLEGVLREIEKKPDYRDPEKYYVSIFGKPGDEKGWGWKFEGHHLALNYTVVGGKEFSVTPSFFGANPGEVMEGEHKGLRVLKAEDELAHALVNVLLEGGKKNVIFSDKAPAEILTAENRKATVLDPVGVTVADMSEAQKKALLELISEYLGRHRTDLAEADMKKIETAGIEKVRFGWAGGTKPGEAWYYRIQGPTFLMESANVQNNANHVHESWRSFDGDFGRDILSEHYREHEKEGAAH
ncbi:DUF3500 domain-containing protein [Luteolibacter soli]|uniref:DUF3500 domain-containing protein n=1 Tax=Luteolibacter soli TaxID=3135280 RepID=A0ABU9AX29_9BACT